MAISFGGKKGRDGNKDIVPPEELSAYERWVLPNMEPEQVVEEFAIARPSRPVRAPRGDAAAAPAPVVEETVAPLTAEDVEAIRQAAYEEGLQEGRDNGLREGKAEGLKKGYDEGYKSGQDDVRAITLRLGQIMRALIDPLPAQDDKIEAALKTLVTNICTQVVRRELVLDSSGVADVVREALECMQPGHKRIRIHLNPVDIEVIERELQDMHQWEGQWRLLAHKTISPGGCIIDTDDSIVDARAEKRLAAVLQQVYNKDAQALQQEAAPRDSLAQVLNEVPAFTDPDNGDSDMPETDSPEILELSRRESPRTPERQSGADTESGTGPGGAAADSAATRSSES